MRKTMKKIIIFTFTLSMFLINVSAKDNINQHKTTKQYLNNPQTTRVNTNDVANLMEYKKLATKKLEEDITDSSIKDLETGLNKAEVIIENPEDYTKEEVSQAEDNIYKAIIYAEADYFKKVDQLIDCSNFVLSNLEAHDLEVYSEDSLKNLIIQLNEAEVFRTDTSVDQDDAKSVYTSFRYAYNNLESIDGRKSIRQLDSLVKEIIDNFEDLNRYEYIPATYKPLAKVVSTAKTLKTEENEDIHKYEVIVNAIEKYNSNLEEIELEELIDNTNEMKLSLYTKDSVDDVKDVLEQIKKIEKDEDEDLDEKEYLDKLVAALSKLELKEKVVEEDQPLEDTEDEVIVDDIEDEDLNDMNDQTNKDSQIILISVVLVLSLGVAIFVGYKWYQNKESNKLDD